MTPRVVLDAAAFDVLARASGCSLRAALQRAIDRGAYVYCSAVTLAEVCRGTQRTRRAEAALVRSLGGRRIQVVPTDEAFAKLVGSILHDTANGSDKIADAHAVAVCAGAESALVLTADPGDIAELAAAVPGTRVLTRDPNNPW